MRVSKSDEWRPEHDRTLSRVLPIVILVALGLFGGGVYFATYRLDLLMHGERAEGVVVELERGTSSTTRGGGSPGWFPVVAFQTADGRTARFRHRTGTNPPRYEKGERVSVVYMPEMPEKALIDEPLLNWLLPALLLMIGAGLSFVSVRGFVRARRRLAALGGGG